MKWTSTVMLSISVLTGLAGYSQITLREKNAPLERVLSIIEKQTSYVFLFDPEELKAGTITIDIKNASLQETLEKCFNKLPIEFSIVGNNVLLRRKTARVVKD